MKKILLFVGFILSLTTFAQEEEYVLDSLLVNIDQSSVTSGIIYERVFPAANLYGFNRNENFDIADFSYFKQALSEMYRASNSTKFISLEAFKDRVKDTLTSNEVELAILNTDFHILHYNEDDPEEGGLLYDSIAFKLTP